MADSQVPVEEFERWLAHGLGRPLIYLRDHDAAPYRDAILDACLHNWAYDIQTEGSRAAHMLSIAKATGTPEFFFDRVIQSLAEPSENSNDVAQRFHFARLLAEEGDARARPAMYQNFNAQPINAPFCNHFVALDGTKGFLFAVEKLGERCANGEELEDSDWFHYWTSELCQDPATKAALEIAATSNPAIKAYQLAIERVEQKINQDRAPQPTFEGAYEHVKPLMQKRLPPPPLEWRLQATDTDLELAARDLVLEKDPKVIKNYLWIFSDRPFPLDPQYLIDLAKSFADRRPIPFRATEALAKLSHPKVREFALERREVKLLVNNFEEHDYATIASWAQEEQDQYTLHRMVGGVKDFYEQHPHDESERRIWTLLYERVACSFCRSLAVERLIALGAFTGEMREECKYDSSDEVRELLG